MAVTPGNPHAERAGAALVLTDRVSRHPGALSAEIDGEVVALDMARGACYGLDAVGARIWSLIETPVEIGQVCATMMVEYDVEADTCRRDVLDLLTDLRAEGLISVWSAPKALEP